MYQHQFLALFLRVTAAKTSIYCTRTKTLKSDLRDSSSFIVNRNTTDLLMGCCIRCLDWRTMADDGSWIQDWLWSSTAAVE